MGEKWEGRTWVTNKKWSSRLWAGLRALFFPWDGQTLCRRQTAWKHTGKFWLCVTGRVVAQLADLHTTWSTGTLKTCCSVNRHSVLQKRSLHTVWCLLYVDKTPKASVCSYCWSSRSSQMSTVCSLASDHIFPSLPVFSLTYWSCKFMLGGWNLRAISREEKMQQHLQYLWSDLLVIEIFVIMPPLL